MLTDILRAWILGITGAAIVTAVTLTITPEGRVKRVVAVVCGFMMLTMLINPIRGFDYDAFRRGLGNLRAETERFAETAAETNANIERAVIEQRAAEYIADKGAMLGVEIAAVSVQTAVAGDGNAYPVSVTVTSGCEDGQRRKLAFEIEANLGIAPEDIHWSATNED